jgi:hypothetical protein
VTGLVGLGTSVGEEVSEGEGMKLVTLETRGAQIAPLKFDLHGAKWIAFAKQHYRPAGLMARRRGSVISSIA